LISEIESNRYFVVMMAYDFQMLRKRNKRKMLWQTRFSIEDLHNHFDKALPAMAQYASRYFGQDSHGLLRKHVPEGQVEVGEPTFASQQKARRFGRAGERSLGWLLSREPTAKGSETDESATEQEQG
jgi:hypothetical protein